jgi:hypothetical protein
MYLFDMNLNQVISQLGHNLSTLESLLQGLSPQQARWKPAPEKWSILEVVNHLYDEERLDFRLRMESVLRDPNQELAPIDPPAWVLEHGYNERELGESFERFKKERHISLAWLSTLHNPRWENTYHHPSGFIRAGDLMASWLAHDLLHLRQIIRLHYDHTAMVWQPYGVGYGGEWK